MTIDTRRLVAEIEEEVRRKRATGELPAEFERELDDVFARYAPVGALDLDFDQVVAKIQESTVIDTLAPLESSRPVVPQMKLAVRKATGWYVRYVAGQVSSMAQGLTRALRLLGDRVDALEAASPGVAQGVPRPPADHDLSFWFDHVAAALAGVGGRVLHADAGSGGLVAHLVAAGFDAYGVEPDDDLALESAARSLDVRADEAIAHLKLLDHGSLGAVVLSGCVDRLALGGQLQLVDLAAAKLVAGGPLLLLGTDPGTWGRSRSPVQVDLAPGRPLHGETWIAMLESRGFTGGRLHTGEAEQALTPVPDGVAGAAEINESLMLLNRTLFGPSSYTVVATNAGL